MNPFRTVTPVQQILTQLRAAQTNLLQARIKAMFYANEVEYQEKLIAMLKEQLSDKDITTNHTASASACAITNPQQPPVRNPNPAKAN